MRLDITVAGSEAASSVDLIREPSQPAVARAADQRIERGAHRLQYPGEFDPIDRRKFSNAEFVNLGLRTKRSRRIHLTDLDLTFPPFSQRLERQRLRYATGSSLELAETISDGLWIVSHDAPLLWAAPAGSVTRYRKGQAAR